MRNVQFEERQNFPLWLWVVAICVFIGITAYLVYVYVVVVDALEDYVVMVWVWIVILDLLMANMFYMITRVNDRRVYVRFGRFFPLIWSRIPLEGIHNLRVVDYSPLWDAGGWGYRYGRFEGEPARFLNAQGSRGVYFEAKRRRYVIGSQDPERLYEVLRELTGT